MFRVSDIKVQNVDISKASVTLSHDLGFTVTGMKAAMAANWAFERSSKPHLPYGSGKLDVDISDGSVS